MKYEITGHIGEKTFSLGSITHAKTEEQAVSEWARELVSMRPADVAKALGLTAKPSVSTRLGASKAKTPVYGAAL